MFNDIYQKRIRIDFDGSELQINLIGKKDWVVIIFLTIWTIGSFFGLKGDFNIVIHSIWTLKNFILIRFIMFTIGEICLVPILIWNLFGKESISLNKRFFKINYVIFGLTLASKKYKTDSIKKIEINNNSYSNSFENALNDNEGSLKRITFDYGKKVIEFGTRLDDIEANYIIEEIKKTGYINGIKTAST